MLEDVLYMLILLVKGLIMFTGYLFPYYITVYKD